MIFPGRGHLLDDMLSSGRRRPGRVRLQIDQDDRAPSPCISGAVRSRVVLQQASAGILGDSGIEGLVPAGKDIDEPEAFS